MTRPPSRYLLLWMPLLAVIASCAGYQVRPMPGPPLPDALEQSRSGVRVQVALLDTHEAIDSAFDIDLLGKGVHPVFVRIENESEDSVRVRRHTLELSTGDTVFANLHPDATCARVRFSPTTRYFVWSFGLFGIGIIPGIADGMGAIDANRTMRDDFHAKLLKNRVLRPGDATSGFVYFDVPKGVVPETFSAQLESGEGQSAEPLRFLFDLANRL